MNQKFSGQRGEASAWAVFASALWLMFSADSIACDRIRDGEIKADLPKSCPDISVQDPFKIHRTDR